MSWLDVFGLGKQRAAMNDQARNMQQQFNRAHIDWQNMANRIDALGAGTFSTTQVQSQLGTLAMSNVAKEETQGFRATHVLQFLTARGLPKAWADKLADIVKVGSGGGSDAMIDNLDTVKEILTMSVPLMKRQIKAVEVIVKLIEQSKDLEAEAPKVMPLANILEETDADGFMPAPRALSDDHLKALDFRALLKEMGERALFNEEKVALVETQNADGTYRWAIEPVPG